LVGFGSKDKNIEVAFMAVFSVLIFMLFFSFLGTNGLIIGNDSAIHLHNALRFLEVGKISLSEAAWYTPLYHFILDTFIVFTGITSPAQLVILTKTVTALVNLLVVSSVYLITSKFFSKKAGVLAVTLLLLCFPLYELNAWGGYTSILALAFMMLTILYLSFPVKGAGYTLMAFIFAFSVVISHQLATFIAVFILPPFIIAVLTKSKNGHYPKALLAAILGGGIAFAVYYVIPILPYLDILIDTIFFDLTLYLYQVPLVSADMFVINFGFVFFLAFAGLAVGFFELHKKKALSFYLLLSMAFLVPLFFSQSYLVGIMQPYQRFIYYMMPPLAVFAGVALSFLIDRARLAYFNNKKGLKHNILKLLAIILVSTLIVVMAVRVNTLSEKISESTTFYSTSDMSSYEAGTWLRENYPDSTAKVVVMQNPGQWFGIYSEKAVIAETDTVVEWIVEAESILDLSYEVQHPLTMARIYETKGNVSENYIYVNMVWTRLSYLDANAASVSFRDQNDKDQTYALFELNRTTTMINTTNSNIISTKFDGEGFSLIQDISASNESYPLTIKWRFLAIDKNLSNVKLFLNYYFDPLFSFTNAYVPSTLNWENPWENASKVGNGWANTAFSMDTVSTGSYVSVYTKDKQTAFGIKFDDVPAFGTVGVLSSRNIDAIRFEYHFDKVEANTMKEKTYQLLTFSQSSIQLEQVYEMNSLFEYQTTEPIKPAYRDFITIAQDKNIGFIVYDAQRFDQSLLNSKYLELIYSNDKYIICKINLK
jgi:asparagine N-glycosylation enzyme membrane subunit Stt3